MKFQISLKIIIVEALIASIAATVTLNLGFPVWIMFIGWVSFFSRSPSGKGGVLNVFSTIIGVLVGIGASLFIKYSTAYLGAYSLSLATFIVAVLVLSMGFFSKVNNVIAMFLGVVTYFALHQSLNIENLIVIFSAIMIGSFAAFAAFSAQTIITRRSIN